MPKRLSAKERIDRLNEEVKEVLSANFQHYAAKLHNLIEEHKEEVKNG